MKNKLLIPLIISLSVFDLSSQNIDSPKLDEYISHFENQNGGIGSISIFKDGKEAYSRSFGQSKVNEPGYNRDTKYHIGSVTKMITGILIFRLVEDSRLSLDDKLSDFYPSIPNADKITIRHMLEHTSGLGDYTVRNDVIWLTDGAGNEEILQEIERQGTEFEPGEDFRYSNTAYYLLTRIIEQKFGMKYGDAVKEYIAKPSGLKNFESIQTHPENVFGSYAFSNGTWIEADDFDFNTVVGLGDIVSTPADMNTLITYLFDYKILPPAAIDTMKPAGDEMFGRGLMVWNFEDKPFYGHGGDTFTTHSNAFYNEKDRISIAFSLVSNRYTRGKFAKDIMSVIYGKEFEYPQFTNIVVPPEELDNYVGIYSSPDLPMKLIIDKNNGSLTILGSAILECYDHGKFSNDAMGMKLEFYPEQKKVILKQGGEEITLNKEE